MPARALTRSAPPPDCRALPALHAQEDSEQRPHKISFKAEPGSEGLMDELRAALKQAGLEVNVIYSAGVDVDVLPAAASKGKALSFLLDEVRAWRRGVELDRR